MKTRPNILFLMADQFRHDYLGAAGASFVKTPNLDRLAKRGIRFTQCITNSPLCSPARIALASGLQPSRTGALDNSDFLSAKTPTYYQRLRDHDYRVGCVGKLDLAKPAPYNGRNGDRPCNFTYGFTHPHECEGKMHAGQKDSPQGPYGFWLQKQGLFDAFHQDYMKRRAGGYATACHDSVLSTDAFEDSYIGRKAAEWIRTIPDDFPWHYFVSFVGPHDPFDPPTEYADRYRNAPMPEPILDETTGKPRKMQKSDQPLDPAKVTETRRQYCAAIELIDHQIGQILAALEKRGMLDNTYIFFSSDHGEMLGDHRRYTKSVPYESALRVPLIVAGPDIKGGRTSDALVELIDINPTICALAGLPPQENIDAVPFTPILSGAETRHRDNTLSVLHNLRCLRTEQYKFIVNYNDISELYDLKADPSELHNIAGDQPAVCKEMSSILGKRWTEGRWLR